MSEVSTLNADVTRSRNEQAATPARKQQQAETQPATSIQRGGKSEPSEAGTVPAKETKTPDAQVVDKQDSFGPVLERLNSYAKSLNRDLRFTVDGESGRTIVRVIDGSTDEVVRQIPTDVALRLAQNLKEQSQLREQAYGEAVVPSGPDSGLVDTRI